MKELKCTIKEIFDAIEELENIQFSNNLDMFFNIPEMVKIQDEKGRWIDVTNLIVKRDKICSLSFQKEDWSVIKSKTALKHFICKENLQCINVSELNIGDYIINIDGEKLILIDKEVGDKDELVYDMSVNSENHLYQTENGIIHHNTTFAKGVATVLNRPFFKIPLGASQDPRSTLIGNTFFNSVDGTYFKEAEFVKAIQTPNAVILLDEYTRAHPDAENILMTVLDHQRYLKLDEDKEQKTINVAEGVCFIATANFGNEFTTTRVLDRATLDRFLIIEMALLTQEQEYNLLTLKYPNVDKYDIELLTKLTESIRENYLSDDRTLSNMVSTRMCEEIVEALEDKFTLAEAFELTILPFYDKDGGIDSERTKIILLIDSFTSSKNNKIYNKIDPNNIFYKKSLERI